MDSDQRFLQSYNVAEVSGLIDVPSGTIREWEKSLEGVLVIPRDEKGNRYYTEFEIQTLRNIKAMREKRVSFPIIRDLLEQAKHQMNEDQSLLPALSQSQKVVLSQSEAAEKMQSMDERLERLEKENQMLKHLMEQLFNQNKVLLQSNLSLEATMKEMASGQKLLSGQAQSIEDLKLQIAATSEQVGTLSEQLSNTQAGVEELISLSRSEKYKRKKILGLF